MQGDVEALLINRLGTTREYYIAPIDLCFELVGLIRMHWRGFSGGEKVWKEIDQFFQKLKVQRAGETASSQKETKKTKSEGLEKGQSGSSPSPMPVPIPSGLEERVGERSPAAQSDVQALNESVPGSTEAAHA